MTPERRHELACLIFDRTFNCEATPQHMEAACPVPTAEKETVIDTTAWGGDCTVTRHNPNEQAILDAMFSPARYSGDEKKDREIAVRPIGVHIPMADMAEILEVGGYFILKDSDLSIFIVDTIDEYCHGLDQLRYQEVHSTAPPSEDVRKLAYLADQLRPLATRVEAGGTADSFWSDILGLFNITEGYVVGAENEAVSQNESSTDDAHCTPADSLARYGDDLTATIDPYSL